MTTDPVEAQALARIRVQRIYDRVASENWVSEDTRRSVMAGLSMALQAIDDIQDPSNTSSDVRVSLQSQISSFTRAADTARDQLDRMDAALSNSREAAMREASGNTDDDTQQTSPAGNSTDVSVDTKQHDQSPQASFDTLTEIELDRSRNQDIPTFGVADPQV